MFSSLKSPNTSLRTRMLFILVLAGIPGIVVAIFLTVQKFFEETRQIETSVSRLAAIGAAQHEAVISNAQVLLEAIVKTQRTSTVSQIDCRAYLKGWTDKFFYFTSITVFDPSGQVVCTNINGELPYTVGEDKWFADTISQQRFTLSDYKLGRDGKALLIAAVPILSGTKTTIGVVALGISLNWLNFISQNVELPPEGSITALGPEGEIMTHHGADRDNVAPPPSRQALDLMKTRESGTLRAVDISDSTRIYGFQKTKLGNIVVIVGLSQFVQYAEWSSALLDTLFPPLFVLLLALLAAAWASEAFVVRHIRSLIATADEIAAGNLQARSDVDYDEHELGELAAAFDTMATSIEQSHSEIEQEAADKELVAREMQHRIANSLAIAQFIAYQTNQHSRTNNEFKKSFGERINALALSNRLLLEGGSRTGDVEETLETVFATHMDPEGKCFHLDGPNVRLDSRATVSLSLTVHELATNAVKYGALSQPGGQVDVRWSLYREKDENWLSLEWQETGGPPVRPASRKGFGGQLMHMMIVGRLGGKLEQTFAPAGLICRLAFPLQGSTATSPGDFGDVQDGVPQPS